MASLIFPIMQQPHQNPRQWSAPAHGHSQGFPLIWNEILLQIRSSIYYVYFSCSQPVANVIEWEGRLWTGDGVKTAWYPYIIARPCVGRSNKTTSSPSSGQSSTQMNHSLLLVPFPRHLVFIVSLTSQLQLPTQT